MLLLAGLLIIVVGCEMSTDPVSEVDQAALVQGEVPDVPHENPSNLNKLIAQLRAWAAPFHNIEKAEEYGYSESIGCIDETVTGLDPEDARGMGYHITRGDINIVDDAVVNDFEPEFLVYTLENGKLKLAAFEYFIPAPFLGKDEDPPEVLGRPMHWVENDYYSGWALHIWLFRNNPDGMFDDFNPEVPLCETILEP